MSILFRYKRGFSLFELLVSMAIVAVLMRVVLFDYSKFNDNISLSSAGQEVAIAIRQAQTYGLNVQEVSSGSGLFSAAYGIYFDPTNSPNNYYIFADTNKNAGDKVGVYDVGSGCGSANTECVQTNNLRGGITISAICNGSGCPPGASTRAMHVTFLRPNPDADINFTNSGGIKTFAGQSTGKVRLLSPKGKTLDVVVESTGQIAI